MTPVIRMHSGVLVDLVDPDPRTILLEDIAYHLAGINRWTGGSRYTDAQHCVHVYRLSGEPWGLLHDAEEAYIGDVSHPLKELLGEAYRRIQRSWQNVVSARFGVPIVDIRQWDDYSAALEASTMWPHERRAGLVVRGAHLPCWSPEHARRQWLEAARQERLR